MKQEVILYKRDECHLCDIALNQLRTLQNELSFDIKLINIDGDDHLTERYGLFIPVVEIGGEVVQYGHIDENVIKMRLQS
ncbi:glutaredoxin family protein [Bacillus andreraoultii]|uniref:glutaredoxin family protein n=1 Tax=Bacillus andreraoultii TaxID=1499685 RepID=UPI00053A4340|nr:glutaredoxin family protein [Bacillus andreraoultii]